MEGTLNTPPSKLVTIDEGKSQDGKVDEEAGPGGRARTSCSQASKLSLSGTGHARR